MGGRIFAEADMRLFSTLTIAALLALPVTMPAQAVANEFAQTQMDVGNHMLTGRPGKSRRIITKKGKVKRASERVTTQNEVVYLYPYTAAADAAIRKFGNNPVMIAGHLGDVAPYKARTFTNTNGYFKFRALKPGRYLLITAVPYEVATTTKEDTGKTRTRTSFGYNGWDLVSANSVTEPIYRYTAGISEFEHRIVKLVEVRADRPVTDLGEVE